METLTRVQNEPHIKNVAFGVSIPTYNVRINREEYTRDMPVRYLMCPKCKKIHRLEDFLEPRDNFTTISNLCKEKIENQEIPLEIYNYSYYNYLEQDVVYDWSGIKLPKAKKVKDVITNNYFSLFEFLNINAYKNRVPSEKECYVPLKDDIVVTHPKVCKQLRSSRADKYVLTYNSYVFKCPDCNHYFWKVKRLSGMQNRNICVNGIEVYETDDKFSIRILASVYFFSVVGKERLITKNIYARITTNKKTGQTYFFPPKLSSDNGYTRKRGPLSHMITMTFGTFSSVNAFTDLFVWDETDYSKNLLCRYLVKKFNIPKEVVRKSPQNPKNCNISDLSNALSYMALKYRFPLYNEEQLIKIYKSISKSPYCVFDRSIAPLYRGYKAEDDANKLFDVVSKNLDLKNSKRLRKIIATNPTDLKTLKFIKDLGFKNNDIKYNYLEYEKYLETSHAFKSELVKPSLTLFYSDYEMYGCIKKFIKKLIKVRGESDTLRLLIDELEMQFSYRHSVIQDTAMIYSLLKGRNALTADLFKGNSLEVMHDKMSERYNLIKHENQTLLYTDEEKQIFEKDYEDYVFRFAIDTQELIKVGNEMHICVGSYGDSALKKVCYIVLMIKEDKYVGCIELSYNKKKLRQAKAKYNDAIIGEDAKVLKRWVEETGIDAIDCNDYSHIRANNFI